jgi:O-antigen/teichoic acid export membrane protein
MRGISKWLPGSELKRNTLWVMLGNGVKLIIQAVYFVIIARSLGPEQYGAFVAVVAIAAILSPFVGLGTSNLIIRNVVRDRATFSTSLGNGLFVTLGSGFCGLALISSCRFLLPQSIPWTVLLLVASSDLILGRLTDLCAFAFGALENFRTLAQINVYSSLTRLIGLLILVSIVHHPTAAQWAIVYLLTTAAVSVGAVAAVFTSLGRPSLALPQLRRDLLEGFYYSAGQSAQSVYNDIDKTMLARFGDLSATGIYGAAYRLIDVSLVPVKSVLSAAYPGCFRAGQEGVSGSVKYMKRLLPKPLGFAVIIVMSLFLCAPVLPHILGKEYTNTVTALRWLALLPLLKTFHFFFADALTGSGYQGLRTMIQFVVAAVNVLVNLWIIPAYSWRGAAWSSLGCDGLLACLYAVALVSLSRRQERRSQLVAAEVGDF